MSDDPIDQVGRSPAEQEAYNEAVERQRRLQVWLDGMLEAGPPLAEAVMQWRQDIPMYGDSAAALIEDKEKLTPGVVKPAEDLLLEARLRIRRRRDLAEKQPVEITEEEVSRRSLQVLADVQKDRAADREFTPLHWVLAARYVEGEIAWDEYRIRSDTEAHSAG